MVYECRDELYSIAPEIHYPRRPELQHASGPNLVAITWEMARYIDAGDGGMGMSLRDGDGLVGVERIEVFVGNPQVKSSVVF